MGQSSVGLWALFSVFLAQHIHANDQNTRLICSSTKRCCQSQGRTLIPEASALSEADFQVIEGYAEPHIPLVYNHSPKFSFFSVAREIILSSNATLKKKIMFMGVWCVLEPVNHWSVFVECFEVSFDIPPPNSVPSLLRSVRMPRQKLDSQVAIATGKEKKVYPNLKIAVYSSQTSQPGLNCSTFSFFFAISFNLYLII